MRRTAIDIHGAGIDGGFFTPRRPLDYEFARHTIYRRRRQALLGHANYGMAGHYASADVGRLIKLANLVLKRDGTCTVLRVANAPRSELCIKGPARVRQTSKRPHLQLVSH